MPLQAFSSLLSLLLISTFSFTLPINSFAQHHPHLHDSGFCMVSADPTPFVITQPDGTTLEVRQVGTAAVNYLETLEGYTLQLDPTDGFYKYVVEGPDGGLMLTRFTAFAKTHRTAAQQRIVEALQPHARYQGQALEALMTAYEKQYTSQSSSAQRSQLINGAFPSTGIRRALLLLIDYPDQAFIDPVASFSNMCNQVGYNVNGQTGSFRDYYLDNSYGQLEVNTDVSGWYTAQHPRATYGYAHGSAAARPLIREAVDAAEAAGVNFSLYDNDNDGDVDVVMVIHSGRGRESSGNDDDIWSHRWSLAGANLSVTYDGVVINDYIVQPERKSNGISNIGVLVHEFGHALGLPDLYDTDNSSSGIGKWCVMAGGTWNNGGRTPAQMNAWAKQEMSWTVPTPLNTTTGGTVTGLAASSQGAAAYRANTSVVDEYFLVEVRDHSKWDAQIPSTGVLVWHIDESRNNNKDDFRRLVDLEQADGNNDLNLGTNNGDGGDVWPGNTNNTTFACGQTVNTDTYAAGPSGISITSIAYNGGTASFSYGDCNLPCAINSLAASSQTYTCSNNTFTQEVTVNASFGPTTGTLDVLVTTAAGTYSASTAATGSAQTLNVAGIPIGAGAMSVTASFSADPACQLTVPNLASAPSICPGANDDVCNALDITSSLSSGQAIITSNATCTAQVNEPAPVGYNCNSSNGWCTNNVVHNSAWYKFSAPTSGSVDITFPSGTIDLQLAVWEAASCSDLLSPTSRWMVAANDDSGPGYAPELKGLACLIPGQEYYIQIDGYGASNAGNFTMLVVDAGLSCGSAPTASADCASSHAATSAGYGEWIHLTDANGRVIASLNDRLTDLGNLTTAYQVNTTGSSRTHTSGEAMLDRDWSINVANAGAATVRYYFTAAEWASLQAASGISQLSQLTLKRFANQSCGVFAGTPEVLLPSKTMADFEPGKHLVEFELTGFSSFTLQSALAPLPVELTSFSGSEKGPHNQLSWTTASEVNVREFLLERQSDRDRTWTHVATVAAIGDHDSQTSYTSIDAQPAEKSYYRLRAIDFDGAEEVSDVVAVVRTPASPSLTLSPNPVGRGGATATLTGLDDATAVRLADAQGRTLRNYQIRPTASHLDLETGSLVSGIYYIQVQSMNEQRTMRLVVQ